MASGVNDRIGPLTGPVKVEKAVLTKDQQNPIILVSAYLTDQLSQMNEAPIHEVREISEGDTPIHYVVGGFFQEAILHTHHRYGTDPAKVADRSHCPFQAGKVRDRFNAVLPHPSPLTEYLPESTILKATIKAFFRMKSDTLQESFQNITIEWVKKLSLTPQTYVYNAVSELSARFIIQGILGYDLCTDKDVRTNVDFWHKLFEPNPTKLQTCEDLDRKTMGDSFWMFFSDGASTAGKVCKVLFDGIEKFARMIIKYGVSEEGRKRENFCAFCYDNLNNYQATVGLVSTLLVAGQESTSGLITALLYEYARNPEMQEKHRMELNKSFEIAHYEKYDDMKWGCYRAYLEALRMYAPGGCIREAAHDMVVRYSENDVVKEHYIRKGDIIGTLPILEGRNKMLFPDPDKFNPDRENLDRIKSLILPFGYKMHQCPGEKGVVQEVMIILTTLLPHVKIEFVDPMPPLIEATVYRPVADFRLAFSSIS